MARRGNNEGSITKRKDGTWQASILVGYDHETGKPKRKYFYAKTRQEVQEKLLHALHDVSIGTFVDSSKLTLGDWVSKWLKTYKKPVLAQTTYELYQTVLKVHILPDLGKISLNKLQTITLQNFYNEKLSLQLSASYVHQMHVIIHCALNQAIKEGLLFRNVAIAANSPKILKKEMEILTEKQLKHFMEHVKSDPMATAIILAVGTGLRRGELLGLKWKDLNFETGNLSVRRQLLCVKGGTKFEDYTKNKKSRNIHIPSNVLEKLKAHKEKQNEYKQILGEAYQNSDLIFCNKNGTSVDPGNFSARFKQLLKNTDIPKIRPHGLRHSHASLLLAKDVHPKIVQERLGHSSISITLDQYSHLVPGLQKAAAEKINDIF